MAVHVSGRVGVVFALRREATPFLKRLSKRVDLIPGFAWQGVLAGRTVYVCAGGVGVARAEVAARRMAGCVGAGGLVVSAGYAGALRPGLRVGDVFTADGVSDGDGRRGPVKPLPGVSRVAKVVTVHAPVMTPTDKAELAHRHDADAVDMESAGVAGVCASRGVRFGCVRAVSDAHDQTISPHVAPVIGDGTVSPWRVLALLARRPWVVAELWRLARDSDAAGRALADALARAIRTPLSDVG